MRNESEYYIEEDYSMLAGPYEFGNKKHEKYLQNVIDDMKRGGIHYAIVNHGPFRYVERKGMILPKRK
jgi:hypothetical protein